MPMGRGLASRFPSGVTLIDRFPFKLSRVVPAVLVSGVLGLSLGAGSALADTITDFAGTGTAGTPTPGPATSSDLNGPVGLAFDSSGDVLIADNNSNQVLKVTPSGTLSVFAGTGASGAPTPGPATGSAVFQPTGIAVDSAGNVYISTGGQTAGGNEVLKVTPSGTLSVIAGNGTYGNAPIAGTATSSPLYNPEAVAVDSSGNVYIANHGSSEILKVTPGGILSVFAGTGASGTPTLGPATSSHLNSPNGVAVDSSGNVYIADTGNYRVEKVTGGTLSYVAGTGTSGTPTAGTATSSNLGQVSPITVSASGNVYFGDENNAEVDEVSGGVLSIVAGTGSPGSPTFGGSPTSSSLAAPTGLVTQGASVYISDLINDFVARVGPPLPVNTTSPMITGTDQAGQTLSATSGSWSNSPSGYAYQWQDCDGSGANCVNITGATASSYTLASGDVGHTVRVVVTAQNSGGSSASANSAVSADVQAAPATPGGTTGTTGAPTGTTGAPTGTTGTAPTGTTGTAPTGTTGTASTGGPSDAVQVPAGTVAAGLVSSAVGQVAVPLACPTVTGGCDAAGTLSISLQSASTANVVAPISNSVIARFSGIQIEAGHSRLVAVKLSSAAIRYLRAHDISRVRVTLTTQNDLSGGPVVTSTQSLWLDVSALTGCHLASGAITAHGVGRLSLGMTRATAHKTGHYAVGRGKWENYCISSGRVQAAYPHQGHGTRIAMILTANHHYAINTIHAGASLKSARSKLPLGTGVHVAGSTWFFLHGPHTTRVVQARRGKIIRIGITNIRSLSTPAQQRAAIRSLR
jgi:sugar lactone lactonase YvrE